MTSSKVELHGMSEYKIHSLLEASTDGEPALKTTGRFFLRKVREKMKTDPRIATTRRNESTHSNRVTREVSCRIRIYFNRYIII